MRSEVRQDKAAVLVQHAATISWVVMATSDKLVTLREVGTDGNGHKTFVVITRKPMAV